MSKILGRVYNLERHRRLAKTNKQISLVVNDSITASFLFLLLIFNHSVSTEIFWVKLNDSFT